MNNSSQNIDLRGLGLPQRLRELRESRHLTQADLGVKAGLTYRTVHDLELGKRKRVQEKTLMLLAAALEVTLPELTGVPNGDGTAGPPPSDSPSPPTKKPFPWIIVVPLLAVLLLGAGLTTRHWALTNARWTLDHDVLTVKDRVLGTKLWSISNPPGVKICRVAPWSASTLLVNLTSRNPQADVIFALKRESGDTLWTAYPDLDAVRRAFGDDVFAGGNVYCTHMIPVDLDGDGTQEILFNFIHTSNYPDILIWVDKNGRRLGQYANHGQFNDILPVDLNRDGKQEVLATGTNNAQPYEGATVLILDEKHFRGASVDGIIHPETTEPDSALYRFVLPNFPAPYMKSFSSFRFHALNPKIIPAEDGSIHITVEFGPVHDMIGMLELNTRLEPLNIVLQDYFRENLHTMFPDSLIEGTGPGDPAWLAHWLAGSYRFEAGHWPPPHPPDSAR